MNPEYTDLLAAIEGELETLLPALPDDPWLRRFFGELPSLPGPLARAAVNRPARELVFRGGKRWSTLLLVLAAQAFGGRDPALRKRAVALAPAVELAHSGSLIVDDIEDGSERRRGGPARDLVGARSLL